MGYFMDYLIERGPYLVFVLLPMLGTYYMLSRLNYLKTIVGLYLFQSGIILFFILLAVRPGASIPILLNDNHHESQSQSLHNPLPHALMLTAIVVGVATLGVALALLQRIQQEEGSIEEDERSSIE